LKQANLDLNAKPNTNMVIGHKYTALLSIIDIYCIFALRVFVATRLIAYMQCVLDLCD